MKVALIGGAGYIGTNLRLYFDGQPHDTLTYDKRAGHHAEDIQQFTMVDYVVHLAAYPGVVNCEKDLERATIDNVSSAFNIFRICHKQKIPCIFISSQAAKFPDHSRYGTIKRMIEIEADRLNQRGADIRVLRFTNVYGGLGYFQMKSTVISNIVKAIREDKCFMINGKGIQKRDFIHVDDICKAIHFATKYGPIRQPLDIGTGVGTSVSQLVKMFRQTQKFLFTYDKKSDMVGPINSIADTSAAADRINFMYYVKLQDWIDCLTI